MILLLRRCCQSKCRFAIGLRRVRVFGGPESSGDRRRVIMNKHNATLGIPASSIARGRPKRQIFQPQEI
jgi:hypothetical protein